MIQHVGGMYWHPFKSDPKSSNPTYVILHQDIHDRMKFTIKHEEVIDEK